MFYISSIVFGLALGAMCIGLFISLKIFNFPDITTDGSYTLGASITAVGIVLGWPLPVVFLCSLVAGGISGVMTGLLHTKLKMNNLLSGILVMTGLYSVNLAILGRSNVPLSSDHKTIADYFTWTTSPVWNEFIALAIIIILLAYLLFWLLKTDFGLAMRATGSQPSMAIMNGISVNKYTVLGLALANGLVAVSGFLVVQLQGFADINMGIGIVIIGLGSVMIGETFSTLFGTKSILIRLMWVILGSIAFRMILSLALTLGIDPVWLKLITAIMVIALVGLPVVASPIRKSLKQRK